MKKNDKYIDITTDQMNVGDKFFVEVRNIFGVSLTQDSGLINECEEGYFDLPIVYDKKTFQHTFFKEKDFFAPLHNLYMDIRYPSKQVAIDIRNKSITLLQYLGNGEFLEYYTDCIIRYENIPVYVNLDDVLQKRVDVTAIKFMDSYVTFMRKYNEYLRTPLYIEKGTLLPFNNLELKIKFNNQEENKQKIKEILLKMHKESIYLLKAGLAESNEQEEIYAYEENICRILAKKDTSNQ